MKGVIRALPGIEVPITRDEFVQATNEHKSPVADFKSLKFHNMLPVLHIIGPTNEGTVQRVSRSPKEFAIVTSAEFPEWLRSEQGLERDDALNVASVYVNSYGVIVGALRRRPGYVRPHVSSLMPEMWQPGYDEGARALPYRAAARAVLDVVGQERLDIFPAPHEPHIASLGNPLSDAQFAQLCRSIQ